MSVQGARSGLALKFNHAAQVAEIQSHVSKRQISFLLGAVKNTNQNITKKELSSIKESLGSLRKTLWYQGSKIRSKKERDLTKIEKRLGKVHSAPFLAEAKSVARDADKILRKLTGTVNKSLFKTTNCDIQRALGRLEQLDKENLDSNTLKSARRSEYVLKTQLRKISYNNDMEEVRRLANLILNNNPT